MTLAAGTRLGPYEIVGSLGAGGMGEVYRARDSRLDRTVAIKVLPAPLADEPHLRERFEREARAISSLNHPHICALYDVGRQAPSTDPAQAIDFLVLEYLEGETLAERLARTGRLAPADALRPAIEICDALDRAHRSGIVHRDLKPANVMLTKGGTKLLDFGLAKSAAPAVATTALSMLPTTPPNLTAQGAILGTFQYMAPEQIEGLEADARSDIFAFGELLFEMLTGRPPFEGKTRASLLGSILKDDPPRVSTAAPGVPPLLDRVVSTCLSKDPDERYQSVRDLLRDLKWIASGAADAGGSVPIAVPERSSRPAWYVAAAAVLTAIATAVWAWRAPGRVVAPANAALFTIAAPENTSFGGPLSGGTGSATQLAVSPDGRHVAFVAGTQSAYQLWLRPIASLVTVPIPGTDGATFPFWSPDGRFIAFFAGARLKKVQITGGPPVVLCDSVNGRGGTWNRDNVIVFSSGTAGTGLVRVSSAGGVPAVVTTLDPATGETNHRWPYFLPDGRHFIYTATTGTCCPAVRPSTIRVGSLESAEPHVTLLQAESSGSYSSGHLLFVRDDTLMAQPFDTGARQLHGDPFPLAEHIGSEGSRYASASASDSTLVYAHGAALAPMELTWLDRSGVTLGTVGDAASYINLALAPDERRIAVSMATVNPDNRDIWIIDLARNIPMRVTFDPAGDGAPVWSPDGSRIAFQGVRGGRVSLRQKVVNETAADEALLERGGYVEPSDWSADGRFIAFTNGRGAATISEATRSGNVAGGSDIWALPLFGDRKPFPVVQTEFTETSAVFSTDGRWIAYTAIEGSVPNVYVQPFQGGGGKYQVSRGGGSHPLWRADGRELFYLAEDSTMMAVPIDASTQFEAGGPKALFLSGIQRLNTGRLYGATKDGKRFIVARRRQVSTAAPLTVVLDWPASVQR